MKKASLCVLMALSILVITTACASNNATENVPKDLGVDLSGGTISKHTNSHGGFHDDGITYTEMKFATDKSNVLVDEIKNSAVWDKLPVTDNLLTVIYGKVSDHKSIGPFIANGDGDALFPIVENGYYYFLDRHSESKDEKDAADLLSRNSFNFTIAIYDIDNQTLYFSEFDT